MNGYIIQNREGQCLNQCLYWFPHDSIEGAFVHETSALEAILKASKSWKGKPHALTPATYSPDEGVIITGKRISLDDDSLRAAMLFADDIWPLIEAMKMSLPPAS